MRLDGDMENITWRNNRRGFADIVGIVRECKIGIHASELDSRLGIAQLAAGIDVGLVFQNNLRNTCGAFLALTPIFGVAEFRILLDAGQGTICRASGGWVRPGMRGRKRSRNSARAEVLKEMDSCID